VQVYQTERGLLDMTEKITPAEFKRIQDEVIIRFKDTNQEKYKVEEAVKLQMEIKNV
jgi:hypothetical protein